MTPAAPARPDAAPLDRAFAALTRYDRGSARGALVPLDQAVATGHRDPALRQELVTRFVSVLKSPAAAPAKEYVCDQLVRLGDPGNAAALGALLAVPELAHAALHVLRSLPGPATCRALLDHLEQVHGATRAGVLEALGFHDPAAALPALSRHLEDADPQAADAAAAGLARMADPAAGRALTRHLRQHPGAVTPARADAALACAARLRGRGETAVARALLDALLAAQPADRFRAAALRLRG